MVVLSTEELIVRVENLASKCSDTQKHNDVKL